MGGGTARNEGERDPSNIAQKYDYTLQESQV